MEQLLSPIEAAGSLQKFKGLIQATSAQLSFSFLLEKVLVELNKYKNKVSKSKPSRIIFPNLIVGKILENESCIYFLYYCCNTNFY